MASIPVNAPMVPQFVDASPPSPAHAVVAFIPMVLSSPIIAEGILLNVAKVLTGTMTDFYALTAKVALMSADGEVLSATETAMPTYIWQTCYSSAKTFTTARTAWYTSSSSDQYPGLFFAFLEPNLIPAGYYWIQIIVTCDYSTSTPAQSVGFQGLEGICRANTVNPCTSPTATGFYYEDLIAASVSSITFKDLDNLPGLGTGDDLVLSASSLGNLGSGATLHSPSGFGELTSLSPALVAQRFL
jgi:hypothetical protein